MSSDVDKGSPRTLAIDIGGTGVKAIVLDAKGKPLTERAREPTPRPATPRAVLALIGRLAKGLGAFDRISTGFPGVVKHGVVFTAPHLHPTWAGFDLAKTLQKKFGVPARVLNDAGVQGLGLIAGRGVEVVLTFGTSLGFAMFVDGMYVPNIELGHHPYKRATYEDYVGDAAFKDAGKKKWNKRVEKVLEVVQRIFNPDRIYLGGGNARHLELELPANVERRDNIAGLTGGIALWKDAPAPITSKKATR